MNPFHGGAEEHLRWCLYRALEYVDSDRPSDALASLLGDVRKFEGRREDIEAYDLPRLAGALADGRHAVEQLMRELELMPVPPSDEPQPSGPGDVDFFG